MKVYVSKQTTRPLHVLLFLAVIAATTSCISRNALVSGVQTEYVTDKKSVLFISGETASIRGRDPFVVEDPLCMNKPYSNETGETLTFKVDETGNKLAILTDTDNQTTTFVFLGYGGTHKATVFGFWHLHGE
jgi:hypothetical protein